MSYLPSQSDEMRWNVNFSDENIKDCECMFMDYKITYTYTEKASRKFVQTDDAIQDSEEIAS